jgi:hypothetical protein
LLLYPSCFVPVLSRNVSATYYLPFAHPHVQCPLGEGGRGNGWILCGGRGKDVRGKCESNPENRKNIESSIGRQIQRETKYM